MGRQDGKKREREGAREGREDEKPFLTKGGRVGWNPIGLGSHLGWAEPCKTQTAPRAEHRHPSVLEQVNPSLGTWSQAQFLLLDHLAPFQPVG